MSRARVVGLGAALQREGGGVAQLAGQPHAVVVVHVHHRGPGQVEQPPLGQVVGLHVGVEVQVVLGQVGEHLDGERDAVGAAQLQRVRGHLHHARLVAEVAHAHERLLQVDGLAGGAYRLLLQAADHLLDRAQQPGVQAAGLEHLVHQEGRGGLAVGAGDARHLHLGRGVAEEGGGHRAHRGPDVVHHHLGHAQAERALAHQRGCAALHGVGGEVVAVDLEAGHTEEERPLGDALARVRQPRDLDLGGPITHQVSQGHGVAKSMAATDGTSWRRPGTSPPSPASRRSPSPG